MKSRTHRVTLSDLAKSSACRTKEDLQWAAQFAEVNPELLNSPAPDRSPSRMQTMPGKSLATCNKPEAQAKGI